MVELLSGLPASFIAELESRLENSGWAGAAADGPGAVPEASSVGEKNRSCCFCPLSYTSKSSSFKSLIGWPFLS